ncbi:hypothetical protein BJ875DRAFT_496955 [Amylocarpus encephaloides]|uniref:V-SNARE coiled-coil homology domain-containing protein n=1 Tax=Amylocarpus encephaloides TaxID=45428 RepID=A0A9P8C3Y6_9HELO|nr:hypothetical protein BJ875DRAFT_496955 [Amylocarpus encephaloides]
MAEVIAAIGVIASVAQLADFGFKLSVKLFSFSQAVSNADSSIKGISNDVSLASTVLQELCGILKADESHVVSSSAIEATQQTVKECLAIFKQLDEALDKSLGYLGASEKGKPSRGRVALEKLKWPFKQGKMELMRSNLDRLKASLTLMLQVLSYAKSISNKKEVESSFEYQRQLIESLARSERVTRRRYEALQQALEGREKGIDGMGPFITANVDISASPGLDGEDHKAIPPADTSIGELLLSFQLLNEVLESQGSGTTSYENLRLELDKFHRSEIRRLQGLHGGSAQYVQAEAGRNVQARLQQLARGGCLQESRPQEDIPPRYDVHTESAMIRVGRTAQAKQPAASYVVLCEAPPAEVHAEIDDTTDDIRENINKVLQRGDRLDDLQDKSDRLLISARNFRRENSVARSPWLAAYNGFTSAIASFGSESSKAIQGISNTVYDAGATLFSKDGSGQASQIPRPVPIRLISQDEEDDEDDEDEGDEDLPENTVQGLLSQWTNLPTPEEVTTKQDIDDG